MNILKNNANKQLAEKFAVGCDLTWMII